MSQLDSVQVRDTAEVRSSYHRGAVEYVKEQPNGYYRLTDEHGNVKQEGLVYNLITDVGDQWAIESAHGLGSPNALTGMRLGTGGDTPPSKNGAGAAIVTYISGSQKAFSSGPSGADNGAGAGYDASYQCQWAAGEATANGIDEFVVTNETPLTDVAGAEANTIARATLSPSVNKAAGDTLTITWTHRHNGS